MTNAYHAVKMSLYVVCLLVIATGLSSAQSGIKPESLSKSLVTVKAYDKSGELLSDGLGFIFDEDCHVVTTRTLLRGCHRAEIETADGKTYEVKKAARDDCDLNLVRLVPKVKPDELTPVLAAADIPEKDSPVSIVELGNKRHRDITRGTLGIVRIEQLFGTLLGIRCSDSCIISGTGLVYNETGQVLGVAFPKLQGSPDSFVWVVPIWRLMTVTNERYKDLRKWAEELSGQELDSTFQTDLATALQDVLDCEWNEAVTDLERITSENKSSARAWTYLAAAHDYLGDVEAALKASRKAEKIDSQYARSYLFSGQAYMRMQELSKAEKKLKNAIDRQEDLAQAYMLLAALYNRGYGLRTYDVEGNQVSIDGERTKHFSTAAELGRKAIKYDPHFYPAYEELVRSLVESGFKAEAESVLVTANSLRTRVAEFVPVTNR